MKVVLELKLKLVRIGVARSRIGRHIIHYVNRVIEHPNGRLLDKLLHGAFVHKLEGHGIVSPISIGIPFLRSPPDRTIRATMQGLFKAKTSTWNVGQTVKASRLAKTTSKLSVA